MPAAPPVLPSDRILAVPLRTEVIGIDRRTFLAVWSGDKGVVVEPARKPGFWTPSPDGRVAEWAMKRRLSDVTAAPAPWYRVEFDTVKDATFAAKRLRREGLGSYVGDDDRWSTRILVETPDWFRQYPMSRPLRFLFIDIEQYSEGGAFPKPDAPLVSIALGDGSGREPWVVVARAGPDGMPDESNVMRAWRWAIEKHDPDIVVVFNAGYDMTRTALHSARAGFPFTEWGRTLPSGERMYSYEYTPTGQRQKSRDRTIYIGGRIVWDLRKNANSTADYNLAGVKDERLKTIAKFLDFPDVIEEDTSNTADLWRHHKGRLAKYNAADVLHIERLARRYLPDRMALAEFYGAPLDMTLDAPGGWGGTVASARVLFQQGIVSDGSNLSRHKQYVRFVNKHGEEADEDDDDASAQKFEGGHVALYKRGLFRPLWKVDFASLYPTVMRATRCGPDNTRIVGTLPIADEPALRTERSGDIFLVYVPDEKYQHTWCIEVRGTSVFTPILTARMEERLAAKKAKDETRANILKTLLNAMFGVHGALSNRYGVYPIAILCTGVSRALIREVEEAAGDAKVETDTDGVYLDGRVSGALLTRRINKVATDLGFEPIFKVESEEFPAGYFHEAKTYLLLTKSGKVKRQGAAMKGKALPAAFDRVLEEVGIHLLQGDRDTAVAMARTFLDLTAFDRREFIQRVRLGKPIEDYKVVGKEVKVARIYERDYGVEPTVGTSYEYIRVKGGERLPPTDKALADMDSHYYLDSVVLTALERIGITREELGVQQRVQTLAAQAKRPRGEVSLFSFAGK